MLLALLFLTIVAQIIQTYVQLIPLPSEGAVFSSWILTTFFYFSLFAALYRWLPDCRLPWWTILRVSVMTAILFQLGRWLIVIYLAETNPGAAFGPASALVVWLLWSFYSALVFLASAELVFLAARAYSWDWVATKSLATTETSEQRKGAAQP